MSSLLRSSKFIRYFAGAARNLVAKSTQTYVESSHLQNISPLCLTTSSNYATRAASSPQQYSSNLEKSLQQLDQDVRRTGRITRKELEEVLDELKQSKSATSSQSLLVIRCCGNLVPEELPQVRTKLVQEIWSTLEKLKVPMDISHYNALLRVYLENEHEFSPAEFLQELEKKGVEPNRVTYQRLVTQYCQQGDIEGATRILEFMREKSLPVNESVFNALIMGHSQTEDMESAAGILNVMKQAGLEPSADTYTTLLVGHAKRGDIEKIREILAECDRKEIYLIDKDHLEIAYALAANGHASHVDEILSRARKSSGFNQDAVSTILRLVNLGQEIVGLKILKMMAVPQRDGGDASFYQGTFFVRQMVKAKRPVENILAVCKTLETEGMNTRALSIATEAALTHGHIEIALPLLKALKDSGAPVRQHYFWPLFCAAGRAKDDDSVATIAKEMNEAFEINVSGETVRDYVIPNLSFSDLDHIVGFLKRAGISSGATASSLVHELLQNNRIADAADVASKYRAFYSPLLLRRALNSAFLRSGAVTHYVNILHHIYDGLDRTFQGEELDTGNLERKELVGSYLLDLLNISREKVVDLKPILEGLLERGLAVNSDAAEQIQSKLSGERLTNEISELLTKLSAPDLEATKAERTRIPESAFGSDEPTLRARIEKAEAAGSTSAPIRRTLLSVLLKNNELDKAEQLVKELGAEAGPGCQAMLIEAYNAAGKPDEALRTFQNFRAANPEANLDPLKLLRLVEGLIKASRIEEGIRVLEEHPAERKFDEVPFSLKSAAFQILNALAEAGDVSNLERAFDLIVKNKYVEVNNVLLGPLIKVHLIKDDVPTALKKFEELASKFKATPWKNELARKLIEKEDAASLQTLTDISSKVHGEINSLYDLVFAFVECGRIRQARKILETPGLRNRQQRLNYICERYQQDGAIASLEGLAEATRDMTHIDRRDIFNYLLTAHINSGDANKALGVWTQMQDEDVQPSEQFLVKLANFLETKGLPVPFVKPTVISKPPVSAPTKKAETSESKSRPLSSGIIGLRNAVKSENIDEVKSLKRALQSQNIKISSNDLSNLIEFFSKKNQLDDAFNVAKEVLERGDKIVERHFKFLSNKLAAAGKVEQITELGKYLNAAGKKTLSYDNKLCGAYQQAGRSAEYIDHLFTEIDSAKSEDCAALEEKFPRGAVSGIVEANPELLPKFEQIADKYHKLGVGSPANVLWISYFLTPDMEERADHVWKTYGLGQMPRLMFARIINKARANQDVALVDRLLTKMKDATISESALGLIYSCSIDVLVGTGRAEEAMTRLNSYIDNVSLENFHPTCLQRLKNAIEAKGKPFPFTIPPKKSKNATSSSSSSDDEPSERK